MQFNHFIRELKNKTFLICIFLSQKLTVLLHLLLSPSPFTGYRSPGFACRRASMLPGSEVRIHQASGKLGGVASGDVFVVEEKPDSGPTLV